TYNGYRQNASGGTGVASVPTALMKQGDFSELGSKLIYDPNSTATVDGVVTRTPFPGNRIQTSRFSSVSSKTLSLIPDPSSPGISNNFGTVSRTIINKDMWSIKGDHSFTDRNRLSVFYSRQLLTSDAQSGLPGPLASGSIT